MSGSSVAPMALGRVEVDEPSLGGSASSGYAASMLETARVHLTNTFSTPSTRRGARQPRRTCRDGRLLA